MILVTVLVSVMHLLAGLMLAKFAFDHWGFWAIFPAFPIGLLVFYVCYQGVVNVVSWVELKLRR